ncbi:MAG: HNH endonuclease [Mariniphaga sp.]
MRPINKNPWPIENGIPKIYRPPSKAKSDLEGNLGNYCSYCEVYSSDLEVEHVISQNQDNTLVYNWDNYLLACGRCNGKDNKATRPVALSSVHLPHRNNTFLSFRYKEGGYVIVNPLLSGHSKTNAENLLDLVCLDKIPGNPKYPKLNLNDTRWNHRRIAWEYAKRKLPDYESGILSANDIVEFALQRGFFSVWFSVYENHTPVKKLLVELFEGTAKNCFDDINGYQPINRNTGNPIDPI